MRAVDDEKTRNFLDQDGEGKAFIRVLRLKKLQERLGVGRSTVYDWMNPASPRYDPTFPRPIRLSSSAKGGAVGWLESEVVKWIESRIYQNEQNRSGL